MKKISYILIAALLLTTSLQPVKSVAQDSGNSSEIELLRKEIEELKQIRKQTDEKMESIESKLNILMGEEKTEEGETYPSWEKQTVSEELRDMDEEDFQDKEDLLKRINEGDKPYKNLVSQGPFKLKWGGYADIVYSWFDHGPDQNRPGGSESDSRLEFDLARFVLELEGEIYDDIGFEAEIEIEHGGTGSALELEFEEFGEFELESENGGEVILEELYLWKKFGDWGKLKAGRFYLAYGLMSYLYKPTNYLAARRPESETMLIPAVWDEIGLSFEYYVNDNLDLTFQVVNGLDSSGFSSLNWVREGHQGKFEVIRASGLAFVGRADYKFPDYGLLVGGSIYYGLDTNENRPENDLDDVDSPLLLVDAHTIFNYDRWRASGVVMYGYLWNAEEISERNSRLPNSLEAPRTPVSDAALAMWGEVGYNINSYVGLNQYHKVEPFVRVDYYDTIFNARDTLFDNPRFERLVLTGGVSYTFINSVFVKMDYAYRRVGDSTLNNENTINLAFGWVY